MSDRKPQGSLWDTPAGPCPVLEQLDLSRQLTAGEIAAVAKRVEERLKNDPVYQSFKRGAEDARRYHDPTIYWNRHSRFVRR